MAKILITRHGETKENVDGVVQGKEHGNINKKGFEQIRDLIEKLKKENISKIISSDVARCKVTTEEILKEINVPAEYISLIREKDNGDFVGKSHKNFDWAELSGTFETRKAPNGENLIEVRERTRKFFKELTEKYVDSNETILIVSHGAFLKILLGDLLGMSLHDSIFKLYISHCSLIEIDLDKKYNSKYQLKSLNR